MHLNMYGGPGAQMGSWAPAVKSSKLSSRDLQRSPDTAKHLYMQHTTFAGVITCVWMLGDATSALCTSTSDHMSTPYMTPSGTESDQSAHSVAP